MMSEKTYSLISLALWAILCFVGYKLIRVSDMALEAASSQVEIAIEGFPKIIKDVEEIKFHLQGFEDRFDDIAERLDRLEKRGPQ